MPNAPSLLPPLLADQRLSVDEFLRRWEAMPELKQAELIDGIVYMPSPVSLAHGTRDALVIGWLTWYASATPGCAAGSNATWLMAGSVPQPDSFLYLLPEYGGAAHYEGHYIAGAAEFVAEVSHSSRSHDLGPKLALYQRAGVREYVSVLLEEQRIAWRTLTEGHYQVLPADEQGIWRSLVFPGLWLHGETLLRGDGGRLLATLQDGLASPEHQEFAQRLATAGVGSGPASL